MRALPDNCKDDGEKISALHATPGFCYLREPVAKWKPVHVARSSEQGSGKNQVAKRALPDD